MRKRYIGFTSFDKICKKKDELLQKNPNYKFINGYNDEDKHFFEVQE